MSSPKAPETDLVAREFTPDHQRRQRIGLDEAIFCETKSVAQIEAILNHANTNEQPLLLTRLMEDQFQALSAGIRERLHYEHTSRTATLGPSTPLDASARVAVVTGGTSDAPVAREATRVLNWHGVSVKEINDVGVAGLWRLTERVEELQKTPVVIAVAGMDAAMPTVLGGLIASAIIAVPTSTGYGAAEQGQTALKSLLTSCAPGVVVVNIDSGYGAACAAIRILRTIDIAT